MEASDEPCDGSTLEHRDLRSALEYAVLMAAELNKRRPPLPTPSALKPYAGGKRIPNNVLGRIRRAIEAEPEFRRRLAAGAVPDLVDEVGRLWLQRPTGWEDRAAELVATNRAAEQDAGLRTELRAEQKRRRAAETAAARAQSEVLTLRQQLDDRSGAIEQLEADVLKASEEADALRVELTDARLELRHARDRERAAVERYDRIVAELEVSRADAANAAAVRDEALASGRAADITAEELRSLAFKARRLAEEAAALLGDEAGREPVERVPLSLPGGLSARSAEAAEFYVRSGAEVVVDGYNVTKLARPDATPLEQRTWLIGALENLARRFGTKVTIVFDGSDVVGAHVRARRLVSVKFSPPDVIADDVIRDFVRWHPVSEPVVVVTNDNEIIRDVRAMGANTLPSAALVAVL